MTVISGKIVFAGGGTGGHVYPALACIEALKHKGDFNFLYIGGYKGIENVIINARQLPLKKIWISGLQRYLTIRHLLFPFKLIVSLFQSLFLLRKYKPQVVVGTGGYVSGPVVYAASKLGIPTLIQEQDSYPGITTRLLARYADFICVPFESVKQYFPEKEQSVLVYGVPVRKSLQMVTKEQAVPTWNLQPEKPVVLVFGGSQGAQALNLAVKEIVPHFSRNYGVQWLWQTGKNNFSQVMSWSVSSEQNTVILDYIDSMEFAYSAADIVISRAGAITLAELAIAEKPCILVPYPHAAAGHQKKNAKTIADLGAAIMVEEGENFSERLSKAINRLLMETEYAAEMGKKWKEISNPDAADKIANQIIKMIKV